MNTQRRLAAVCLILNVVSVIAVPLHAATPKISFERRAVVADGITQGGDSVWFAVVHDPQAYHERTLEIATVVRDLDGDGIVRLELKRDFAPEAVWVVVDLATGKTAIQQPSGAKVHTRKLPEPLFVKANGTASAHVTLGYEFAHFWLVRPSVGAWTLTVEDGGRGDFDRSANGVTFGALAEFQPVDSALAPPADFLKDDLLFAIDPLQLAIAEIRLAN
jgi:hypothetical protein